MINPIVKTIELNDGRTITLETGKLAKQADGAVMLRMGNTMLLATVCAAKDAVPGTDFMPLQVEYREKYSAFGRFPGGFTKREGKASDYEILTCRLVDRALRPLFPDNYHAEVYVNIILYSADGVDMPDALAGLAASAALAVSDIPFGGPISEVRVARIDGQFVINPTFEALERADMDIMVAATYENIMMVEGEMKEVSEQDLLEAMKFAHEAIKVHCKAQMELMEEVGKTVKREYCHEENDEDLRKAVHDACYEKAYAIAKSGNKNKHERGDAFDAVCEEFKAQFSEEELEEKGPMIDRYYHDVEKEAMRRCILDEGKRLDGRATTEIRPIWCEVSPLPMPHGSSIFTRGETQSLSTVTLGTKLDEDTLIVGTSGRYEFKNKGINVYLESLNRLTRDKDLKKPVLAFINVPGWVGDAREDLRQRLDSGKEYDTPLECPFITHWLHNMSHDQVLDMLKYMNMTNVSDSKVKVVFVPCYLDGRDGIVNEHYYDLLIGMDLSVYPSYYEPWGYTPLESIAFKVPTITTDLAGFGLWVNTVVGHYSELTDGVKVIHRTDYNYSEVADTIKDTIAEFSTLSALDIDIIRKKAAGISDKALWKNFIKYYYEAYDIALQKAEKRIAEMNENE